MKQIFCKAIFLCILGALWVSQSMAVAQDTNAVASNQGVINAVSFKPLEQGRAVSVVPLDNSDENIAIQGEFEKALQAAGYTISADADMTLFFETRDQSSSWSDNGNRRILELSENRHRRDFDAPQVNLNLYDSSRGGMFNKGKAGLSMVTKNRFRIDATLDDKQGKRLWQAWSVADIGSFDKMRLAKTMAPGLIENLGKTVKKHTFSIP
jgi:hypothetical protein